MIKSRYWWFHAFFVAIIPAGVGLVALVALIETISPGLARLILIGGGILLIGAGIFANFGALAGYHAEAKLLRKAGSEWVPVWWVWIIAQLVLSPVLVAPVYLAQRWRHIGLRGGS